MAMATDPFDPHISSFEQVAAVRRALSSPPAHLPPMALMIPTFFGAVRLDAAEACAGAEARHR
ncbi:MAG: hypothetical protein WD557_03765 [Dehalococcoidia bacterium]